MISGRLEINIQHLQNLKADYNRSLLIRTGTNLGNGLRIKFKNMKNMEGKYLVTTDEWFYAPDGKKYKSAWGSIKVLEDSILGLKTNRNSTNWFAKIGSDEKHIIVAGCQIHYAVRCDKKPNSDVVDDFIYSSSDLTYFKRPSEIYIAE